MSINTLFLLASATGVLAHLNVFIKGEWHMQAPIIFVGHVLAIALTFAYQIGKLGYTAEAYASSVAMVGGYIVGLLGSMVAYRLSPLHRLYKFSGPRIAAVTKMWHVWQCRDSRNHQLMDRLYKDYNGSPVRIGPNEVVVFDADAFKVLEGWGTRCRKSDFYDLLLPDFSLVFTRNKEAHDARRSIWSKALSTQAISQYLPRITRQIQTLMENLDKSAAAKKPVLINDIFYWFTFDSMGEFAFNQDFGMMRHQEWHHAINLFRRALSIVGPFQSTIWLIKIGFALVPWFWKIGDWFKMLAFCNHQMNMRMENKPSEVDISSYFLSAAEKDPNPSARLNWLRGDGATVVVAGSDTTAPSLTFLCYTLAKHPETVEKIYEELQGVDPLDLNAVCALPHLNGTINEVMRLYSVAPTVVSRETPPEGVTIGNNFIPGNTKVLAPRWVIFRLESCFEHANDFVPERWYSRLEMVKDKSAFSPFGNGRASCVGQGLATTQLRLVLASMVKRFRLHFPPGDDGSALLRDMRDQLTAQPGKLNLIFEPR